MRNFSRDVLSDRDGDLLDGRVNKRLRNHPTADQTCQKNDHHYPIPSLFDGLAELWLTTMAMGIAGVSLAVR